MSILAIIPTEGELLALLGALTTEGHEVARAGESRLPLYHAPTLDLFLAMGGLGKAQFAVQTQYLLDRKPWELTICAGAAGALVDEVAIGDVVVATETVEHDIRKVGRPLVPRFQGDEAALARCRAAVPAAGEFQVHFGGIASGDEDVVDAERRAACRRATGALAVAWEGAGGARACAFSGVPFLEIRGIADRADRSAPREAALNLPTTMQNVAAFLRAVARTPSSAALHPAAAPPHAPEVGQP